MIEARHIYKSYDNKEILKDVNLTLEDGRLITLIGASGIGKTTLLRILALYEKPDQGQVLLDGKPITKLKDVKGQIQVIHQHPYSSFNPKKRIIESLKEGIRELKICKKDDELDYITQYLERMNISKDAIYRYPEELSGGELQRISISRALAVKPRVLLCDEITSSLDAINARELVETIKNLKNKNIAILFITHDLDIGRYIATDILELKDSTLHPFCVS